MAGEQQADAALREPQDTALEGYTPWLTPRRKLIAGGVVLAIAFAAIVYLVAAMTGQPTLEVSELQAKASDFYGKDSTVRGIIVPGSTVYGEERTVTFQIVDRNKRSGPPLEVLFKGVPQGQFSVPSVEVVLEGVYQVDQVFHASAIITRESRQYIPVTD